jgi:hypothetical protein
VVFNVIKPKPVKPFQNWLHEQCEKEFLDYLLNTSGNQKTYITFIEREEDSLIINVYGDEILFSVIDSLVKSYRFWVNKRHKHEFSEQKIVTYPWLR